jgi:hypothetical protein
MTMLNDDGGMYKKGSEKPRQIRSSSYESRREERIEGRKYGIMKDSIR